MNRPLYVRGTMVEDGQIRDLVIVDGVVADATPLPSPEPDAAGWVLPGLADVHNQALRPFLSVAASRHHKPGDASHPGLPRGIPVQPGRGDATAAGPGQCHRSGRRLHRLGRIRLANHSSPGPTAARVF
jgi:hypothetical protein